MSKSDQRPQYKGYSKAKSKKEFDVFIDDLLPNKNNRIRKHIQSFAKWRDADKWLSFYVAEGCGISG